MYIYRRWNQTFLMREAIVAYTLQIKEFYKYNPYFSGVKADLASLVSSWNVLLFNYIIVYHMLMCG